MEYTSDNIRLVTFALYCKEISEDKHDTFFVKQVDIKELWRGYERMMEGLKTKHFGDCTKDAITCLRCQAEWFIEDAKYIIDHWQENDEITKERKIEIEERLNDSMVMNKAIRNGDYRPITVVETTSGQSTVSIIDRNTRKTWDELKDELCKKYLK